MYREIGTRVDLTALEHEVLDFWKSEAIFEKSVASRSDSPTWIFYEGPPTANGLPGAHHVEARVFKDVFPRYRTMRGYQVPRRAGWDCHGLPVELAVEKELGFTGKSDIEKFGVAEFNNACRESVLRHVDAFTQMTDRMGYWVDFDEAYWTMSPQYIESVWWSLSEIHKKGLLTQDFRVSPYCPRCGTGLSDHEVAQGYQDVVDRSIYLKFKILDNPLLSQFKKISLLVWTTTPWTLISNTAVAVGEEIDYLVVSFEDEQFVVAKDLASNLFEEFEVLKEIKGKDLVGINYQPPFALDQFKEFSDKKIHSVLAADFVTTSDGSGIVHLAPAFGADDMKTCRLNSLPVINPVLPNGVFDESFELVRGQFFKDADKTIIRNLIHNGLLFKETPYQHSYPHCWRCKTPLMYYAQPAWYIKTTAIKDQLLAENEKTNWIPETIKYGRYGDWLNNNVDWALSRNRYWGTPLPIWICENSHQTAVSSLSELSKLSGNDVTQLDPHRPFVDEIEISCPQCDSQAKRVPEVIDCWYDSGSMPFAQLFYPQKNKELFNQNYPADFICEAIDQTRGWFYTLMAIGTLVFEKSSFKNVVALGHILDEKGRKMSKHLGNVLEPIPLMDEHGADSVRWFMLAGGSPWQSRRLGHAAISEVTRKVLLTLLNSASFLSLYGRLSDVDFLTKSKPVSERPSLDRWIISLTNKAANQAAEALDQFDTQRAGKLLAEAVDDLSNWYVRRSRRRFWDSDPDALATLHQSLRTLTLIMAPFVPFITERIWQDLFRTTSEKSVESVHLANWPVFESHEIDETLLTQMQLVRNLVELGRSARAESKIKNRQPLSRALIAAAGWDELPDEVKNHLPEELNILQMQTIRQVEDLVDVSVKANFRNLGTRYGSRTNFIAQHIKENFTAEMVEKIRVQSNLQVEIDGEPTEILLEDLIITETPREGWAVASADAATVALDLALTPELKAMGLSREVIRLIQENRKLSGFDVSDRIYVNYQSDNSELVAAIETHKTEISQEVLAVTFENNALKDTATANETELQLTIWLQKAN
jgi:isoleucyl-tRNA synthetase